MSHIFADGLRVRQHARANQRFSYRTTHANRDANAERASGDASLPVGLV
jgi:hypothetical protein